MVLYFGGLLNLASKVKKLPTPDLEHMIDTLLYNFNLVIS